MFIDEIEKKLSNLTDYLPYVIFAFVLWLVFITIMLFLLYFNIVDINTIIENMKKCVVSL